MTELAQTRMQLEHDRKQVIEPLERIAQAMRDEDRVSKLMAELLAKGQGRRDPGAADR